MHSVTSLLKRFRKDERGVFAVIFAVMAIVLIATSGAVVDFTMMQQARTRAQTALDAATLALQSKIKTTTEADLGTEALAIVNERLNDTTITTSIVNVTKDIDNGKLNIQASIIVPTAFVQLVGINSITAFVQSEVTRASNDLEVSVALDVTGSMAGSKITSLKTATNDLIDLLVKDSQTPTYSKMAIIPWSNGVNLTSTYANAIRGTPIAGKTITNAKWADATLKDITISAITKSPNGSTATVIKFGSAQTFSLGDYIWINNSTGIGNTVWNLLGVYRVGTVAADKKSFGLKKSDNTDHNSNSYSGSYTANSGRVSKCLNAMCELIVTATAHGIAEGKYAYITNTPGAGTGYATSGTYKFTSKVWRADNVTANTFIADATDPRMITANAASNYTGTGGTSYCTVYKCTYQYFTNNAGGTELWTVNNCATERLVANQYNDAAPSTTKTGMSYREAGADCIPQTFIPLSSDKDALKALVTTLAANGSTAGHIGLAWGWYMIAPNWAYLWPAESQPAEYGKVNLVKAVIFMTDGDFNTVHCNGVISADTLSSSNVADSERINCNADNGLTSKAQAQKFCDAIKVDANKTYLYTVGFDLAGNTSALTFLQNCATAPDYFYQADTGADLAAAFKAIAQNLSALRISK